MILIFFEESYIIFADFTVSYENKRKKQIKVTDCTTKSCMLNCSKKRRKVVL